MSLNKLPKFDSQTDNRFVLMPSCCAASNVVIKVNYNEMQKWHWSCGDVEQEWYNSKDEALQSAVKWLKAKLLTEQKELKARLAEVDVLLEKIG
jgi:hypothetical protein